MQLASVQYDARLSVGVPALESVFALISFVWHSTRVDSLASVVVLCGMHEHAGSLGCMKHASVLAAFSREQLGQW